MTKDNPGFIQNLNPRDRETKILECDCGWKGTFAEGFETWDDDGESTVCPRCLSTVAQIWFPTIQEMLDSGDPSEVRHAELRDSAH